MYATKTNLKPKIQAFSNSQRLNNQYVVAAYDIAGFAHKDVLHERNSNLHAQLSSRTAKPLLREQIQNSRICSKILVQANPNPRICS
jgi:hypothetical protein